MKHELTKYWQGIPAYSPVLFMFFCLFGGTGASAEPVALVLEISGEATPRIEAFSEIEAGNSFELGAESRLEFLHYPTCQRVVVEGGRLNLSAENFRVNKGKVIDISRAECPQRVKLAMDESSSGIGGVVLRGTDTEELKVSRRPAFMVFGRELRRFTRLQVKQGPKTVLEADLPQKPLFWPENQPELASGCDYTVQLSGPDGASRSIPLAVSKQEGQKIPAVIHID